jgi:hypothetical protein
MQAENQDSSIQALNEIRSIMDRSARFISLSGWSGIWAGTTALAGAAVAWRWLQLPRYSYVGKVNQASADYFDPYTINFIWLGLLVFCTALLGGFYFTWRKAQRLGHKLWNNASRQMLIQLFFPLFAGGVFSFIFIYYGIGILVPPACLAFYGLSLISASRHTYSDIRYLGMLDVTLGCASLFFPGFGLYFWALGFGVLHILYGAIMWNKYDK